MRVINTSDLRSNIANVLNSVYLDNEVYEIKKSGLTVATLARPEKVRNKPSERKSFWDFAGAWNDDDDEISTDELLAYIKEGRSDRNKEKRKLPSF